MANVNGPSFNKQTAWDRDGISFFMKRLFTSTIISPMSAVRRGDIHCDRCRQYVSSRYIEGYVPQALNMVMTLSANEAENIFTFEYDWPSTEGGGTGGGAG